MPNRKRINELYDRRQPDTDFIHFADPLGPILLKQTQAGGTSYAVGFRPVDGMARSLVENELDIYGGSGELTHPSRGGMWYGGITEIGQNLMTLTIGKNKSSVNIMGHFYNTLCDFIEQYNPQSIILPAEMGDPPHEYKRSRVYGNMFKRAASSNNFAITSQEASVYETLSELGFTVPSMYQELADAVQCVVFTMTNQNEDPEVIDDTDAYAVHDALPAPEPAEILEIFGDNEVEGEFVDMEDPVSVSSNTAFEVDGETYVLGIRAIESIEHGYFVGFEKMEDVVNIRLGTEVGNSRTAFRVFGTAINLTKKFVRSRPVNTLVLASVDVDGDDVEKRARIYQNLVQKWANEWDCDVTMEREGLVDTLKKYDVHHPIFDSLDTATTTFRLDRRNPISEAATAARDLEKMLGRPLGRKIREIAACGGIGVGNVGGGMPVSRMDKKVEEGEDLMPRSERHVPHTRNAGGMTADDIFSDVSGDDGEDEHDPWR